MRRVSQRLSALMFCAVLALVAVAAACTQNPPPPTTSKTTVPAQTGIAGDSSIAAATSAQVTAQSVSASAAATVGYTCSGLTNDQASYVGVPGSNVQSSAQVLSLLASTIPNFPANPTLSIDISPTVPATAAAGTPYSTVFDFSASLPASFVSGAQALGLTSVTATNATFNIGVTGGTPTNLSSFVASQTVGLVAGATISHAVTGSVSGSGSMVTYRPGIVTLGLNLNVNVLLTHIDTISVTCSPTPQDLAGTTITGGGATTTTVPTATTVRPTTTTTVRPTTTTVRPTAVPPTTAVAPTTVPKRHHHHHHHHHRPRHTRRWFGIFSFR
jgi:hypothetical protein